MPAQAPVTDKAFGLAILWCVFALLLVKHDLADTVAQGGFVLTKPTLIICKNQNGSDELEDKSDQE